MLKWLKDFTMKILKWATVTIILLLLVNGMDIDVKFSATKSKERTIDMFSKVKDGITVASSVRDFLR